ncbi:MAG: glycosyltransferase family 39 protein [Caldilineaceae bacterium]|nr:glycosyltransferase family 39 protein [Caldilineaceae bacterium]
MSRPMYPALPWRLSPVRMRLALGSYAQLHAVTLIALTTVGFALRLGLLSAFPLREDEAIYGYWARSAITDPFFLHVWPDKPPLFIWLLTGAFALLGPSEAAARLVSIFSSTLTIPLVALGAQKLWRSRPAALMAALLLALNPYAVSFAPTAYTDSLLVLLGTGAVVLALGAPGRLQALGAGLLFGAACMTKQQGIFYVPLVFALLWRGSPPNLGKKPDRRLQVHSSLPTLGRVREGFSGLGFSAFFGIALITLPILLWDSQRWAVAPSPWDLAQRTYAPLTWLPPQQWPSRWDAWAEWLWYLGGNWIVWGLLAAAMVVAASKMWRHPHLALMLGWGVGFIALHLVTSVQVWDRYLLPLAPWLALVASGPLALAAYGAVQTGWRRLLLLLLVVGMVGFIRPALDAAQGRIPIGGDHGDYAGLTAAVAWLENGAGSQEQSEIGSPLVLYHQVLGWHFRFYLYDALQPRGDDPPRVDLRWFPSAAYLADNAAKTPYPPKFLIVPDWATPRDLSLHLALRGLTLEPRLHVGRFAVLEVVQPPRPLCDWCMSRSPGFSPSGSPFASHFGPLAMPQMSTP